MNDTLRTEAMKEFFNLYDEASLKMGIQHMPNDRDDPNGESFDRYFNFLQGLYLLKAEYPILEESEVENYKNSLINTAKEFNYPVLQIEVL
jgi:hypothetical protein